MGEITTFNEISLSREVPWDFCYILCDMEEDIDHRSCGGTRKAILIVALAAKMAANLSDMNAGYYYIEGREKNLFL